MEAPIVDNEPDIVLYSAQTPNGIKISMTLEELGSASHLTYVL